MPPAEPTTSLLGFLYWGHLLSFRDHEDLKSCASDCCWATLGKGAVHLKCACGDFMKLWHRRKSQAGFAAVGIHPDGVSFVQVEPRGQELPLVSAWEFRPVVDGADFAKVLAKLADDHGLRKARCTTLLDPFDYRLLAAEAPPVPPDELAQAMRWRIKDLLDFNVQDATLEVFPSPVKASGSDLRAVYVVVAHNTALRQRIHLLDGANINLEAVDIPELALRNVASLMDAEDRGVALLCLAENSGFITLTRRDVLYMSRTLNIALDELRDTSERAPLLERIVLEVQRSLDYYVSHLRQAPVDRLVLAPLPSGFPGLEGYFSDRLGIPVSLLRLNTLAQWPSAVPSDLEPRCLATFGAALRQVH